MSKRRSTLVTAAARRLRGGDTVLVGVGLPAEAAIRARDTHAPDLTLIYESGAVGARPTRPALSIGDPTLVSGTLAVMSLNDVFTRVIEAGRIDVAFVGAAEIDRRGRLNSTVIGTYRNPKVRLPGSGGACEIVNRSRRVIVLAPLERRRFPDRISFVTSAPGPDTEVIVVTDRGVLAKSSGAAELELTSYFPGESPEAIADEIGWDLAIANGVCVEEIAGPDWKEQNGSNEQDR